MVNDSVESFAQFVQSAMFFIIVSQDEQKKVDYLMQLISIV